MLRHAIVCTAAAALLAAGCNRDRQARAARTLPAPESATPDFPAPATDVAFLQAAAMGGLAEVELGTLAMHRAESEEVRRLARMMVDDHTAINSRVAEIARARNVVLPSQPSTPSQMVSQQLQQLEGNEFDRLYLRKMVEDHERAIVMYESRANLAEDPRVRDHASGTLPMLRNHLELARGLVVQVGSPTIPGTDPTIRPRWTEPLAPDQPRQPSSPTPTQPVQPAEPTPTEPGQPRDPADPGAPPR